MPLKNLAHMPKKFYLDLPGAEDIMVRFPKAMSYSARKKWDLLEYLSI